MSPVTHLLPVGPTALLAEVADADQALSLALFARAARVPAVEVVPAAATVLFDGLAGPEDADAVRRVVADWSPARPAEHGDLVELPTTYDGADLDDVAQRWGTDRDGVVARHAATTFVSAFCGFAPGFAYLGGLPAALAVPRLDTPRTRVPAGSVGLAGAWCGVYPTGSPGGWRLLGRTDAVLWDPARADGRGAGRGGRGPALLAPGTRVRFVPA